MGAKGDISFFLFIVKILNVSGIEGLEGFGGESVVADVVEEVNEVAVRLSIDVLQFNRDELCLLKAVAAEEVGGVVMGTKEAPVYIFYHWRELVQVTNQQELYTTKGAIVSTVFAQNAIYAIQQVGADHAYLVDYQQIEIFDNVYFFPVEFVLPAVFTSWNKRSKWHLEKRVESNSAGVDRRNTSGCCDDHSLRAIFFQFVEEGGFSGASFSGQENIATRVPHKFCCQLEFCIFVALQRSSRWSE